MKNQRVWLVGCLSVAMAVFVAPARAADMVPFTGTWEGVTTSAVITFPIVTIVAEGEGHATHLGHYTMTSPHTTDVITGETIGDQIFVAANGDTLTAHCEGFPQSTDGGLTVIGTLDCTFTSGTGRFEGATGSYEFFLTATLAPGTPGYATVATLTGEISR